MEDALRILVAGKKDAIILDFFCGSGTTAHAVMRLNRQDNGSRQCICITNNEVAAEEQSKYRRNGLRPGDLDWEQRGICENITKPRVIAALTGKTPDGNSIKGDYKFIDEFPMAEGFGENVEFFTLTYESPISVSHNRAFARISPLLWLRAGGFGKCIQRLSDNGKELAESYGVLIDLDKAKEFCEEIRTINSIRVAYIVTDDDRRFQSVARSISRRVEVVRLYESYLNNFRFSLGR